MFHIKNGLTKTHCFSINVIRHFSSKKREYQEVSIQMPWGQVAGKWWEPYDVRPILTLHGWQDNCGSFDRLIPMLNKNVGFLAIDFPGHGYSSRIPVGMYYSSTLYQITIRSVVNYFNWPKVSLMGHSLGGVNSFVFTMLYPEEVDFVICLDGAKPMIQTGRRVMIAKQLQNFLKINKYLTNSNEPPSYTLEEITKKICTPNRNSILPEVAHYIIERSIVPSKVHPGKYYFIRDPRLKAGEIVNFCQDELIENAQYLTPPIFMSKARNASYYELKENFYEVLDVLKRTSKDCDFNYVDGTHHVHLNNPENEAELVTNFIRRNNIEDRSLGGIKDEIIVPKPEIKLAELRS